MTAHGKSVFHAGIGLRVDFGSTTILTHDIAGAPTASWSALWPADPPPGSRALTMDGSGNIGYAVLGGGGTVTSFSAGNLSSLFTATVDTATTTPALSFALDSQTANRVFAGPASGGAAAPTFRALVFGDVAGLVGTGANTIAAGNDTRLHTQNTDTGTTQSAFQVDSGNGGPRVKNESGALAVRNAADNSYADLILRNLTVQGTTTTINTETVLIADNILALNSNFTTGTPTEDMGIRGARGSSTAASLIFSESLDLWLAGLEGAEIKIARGVSGSFTAATLTSGVLAITHALGNQWPQVTIYDNTNKLVLPDEVTGTSATVVSVDLTTFGTLSGTWRYEVVG